MRGAGDIIRGVLRQIQLAIKNQVAWPSHAKVASDEVGIVLHECLRVCELGEGTVTQVFGAERAWPHAKEVCAQGCLGVGVLADRRQRCEGGWMVIQPGCVVGVEGFAVGKAEQSSAVVDLRGEFRLCCLCFGDGGKPGAEGLLVLGAVETEEVGGSVPVGVCGVEEKGYWKLIGVMAP